MGGDCLLPFPKRLPAATGSPNAGDIQLCVNKSQAGAAVRAIGHLKRYRARSAGPSYNGSVPIYYGASTSLIVLRQLFRPPRFRMGATAAHLSWFQFLFRALTACTPWRSHLGNGKEAFLNAGTCKNPALLQKPGGLVAEKYLAAGLTAHGNASPGEHGKRTYGQGRNELIGTGKSTCFRQERNVGRRTGSTPSLARARDAHQGGFYGRRFVAFGFFTLRFVLSRRSQARVVQREQCGRPPDNQEG